MKGFLPMAKWEDFLLILLCSLPLIVRVVSVSLDDIEIRLVNGSAPNEGRVLVRWLPDFPDWAAVCLHAAFPSAVPFQMCRNLGYPFACGTGQAGAARTNDSSLAGVDSGFFLPLCSVGADFRVGGCSIFPPPPGLGTPCTHDQDLWLSCGYEEMPGFELRLTGPLTAIGQGLLEARCGAEFEWGALCGNTFVGLKHGNVACRELGYSDRAVGSWSHRLAELSEELRPASTLFVDQGCVGDETSLSQCPHYALRECEIIITLECFTEVTEYDNSSYLCGSKQLCGSQCSQTHPNVTAKDAVFHYCQCDDACALFGDCCHDYERRCRRGEPSLSRGGFGADRLGCVWVPGSRLTHVGYVAVNQCPDSWGDRGAKALCEAEVDENDVIGSLPFYDEEGVDFKNIYCAYCNGRSLDNLKAWELFASKNSNSPTDTQFFGGLNRTLPTKAWVVAPPPTHDVIRKCPAHLVDACLPAHRGTSAEEACGAYYAPLKVGDTEIRYRNPHCALCNGETLVPENSCVDQVCRTSCAPVPWVPCQGWCSPYDGFLTIEVLFDLSSPSADGVPCPEGQVYDPFLERCRVLSCAAGYQIQGEECVPYRGPTPAPPIINDTGTQALRCLLSGSLQGATETDIGVEQLTVTAVHGDAFPGASSLVYAVVASPDDALRLETRLDAAIADRARLGESQFLCNVSDWSILLAFPTNVSQACSDASVEAGAIFPGQSGTLLVVARYRGSSVEQIYTKEEAAEGCLRVAELNCSSLLTLDATEYDLLPEMTAVEIKASGAVIPSDGYVMFLEDGSLVTCPQSGTFPEGLEPQIRRGIAFAGSLLSLLALAATFVTYCVFPKLRNDAGKSLMNLVVALFAAFLLFLLAGYLGSDPAACEIGAALAHLAWLAAFCWMLMLGVGVARTFASSRVPRAQRRPAPVVSRALLAYGSVAWGLPLAVVACCLVLHYCGCVDGVAAAGVYARGGVCWITDRRFVLGAFVGPVAFCLALVLCLFIFTAVSIRRTRKASRTAREDNDVKDELAVYAKLSSLMGVTWVFGFVLLPVTNDWLNLVFTYIYILTNNLQGVFIFVSFCLNKRVRDMWREKLSRVSSRRRGGRGGDKTAEDDPKDTGRDDTAPSQTASSAKELTESTRL